MLKQAGLLGRWNRKPSAKGTGFEQPQRPHRDWHLDIAYLNICGTFYHLISVLDGYSRYIVHWEIRESMTEHDVEIVLQRAREQYPDETPRIITDNGPQFIAKDFKQFIRISGMTHVKTSPYYPQSNGKLERFHRTIKADCIRPGTPLSLEDARRIVAAFVTEYNEARLHSAIGYVTPLDKLLGRDAEIFAERDRKLEAARTQRALRRRQSACYTEDAWPEDRALVATNPSAVPGPEARSQTCRGGAEDDVTSSASSPLLLAQCAKRNPENTAFSPL